jgi:hypothetical protein
MFRSCPQNFTAAGLGNTLRGVFGRAGDRMAAIKPNSANCGSWATPCLAEATRRRFVGAVSMGSLLCRCQRLGAQREEAHHVASERKPQQMDAGLDLAAQR